jgi:hypothetical protein
MTNKLGNVACCDVTSLRVLNWGATFRVSSVQIYSVALVVKQNRVCGEFTSPSTIKRFEVFLCYA